MKDLAKKINETRAYTIERMHVVESIVSDFMHDYNLDQSNYYYGIDFVKSRLTNKIEIEWIIDLLKELKRECIGYANAEKLNKEQDIE